MRVTKAWRASPAMCRGAPEHLRVMGVALISLIREDKSNWI